MLSEHYCKMIIQDIDRCDAFLSKLFDETSARQLHLELTSKYTDYIPNFLNNLWGHPLYGEDTNWIALDDLGEASLNENIIIMTHKLKALRANGFRTAMLPKSSDVSIINKNHLAATQTISISFENAREQIKNMSGLTEEDERETLGKVSEIESIVDSDENKKGKWKKIKPILEWLITKSVDVALVVLPLLLKIEK